MLEGDLLAVGAVDVAVEDHGGSDDLTAAVTVIGAGVDLPVGVDGADLIAVVGLDDDVFIVLGDRDRSGKIAGSGAIGAAIISARDVRDIVASRAASR